MGLSNHLLLLSVFTCQAFTRHTVALAPTPAALCWQPSSPKCPPHAPPAAAGSSWVVQHYSSRPSPSRESLGQAFSLPCNQKHLMAHPWPGHDAMSHIREKETWIGRDLRLWAIHLTRNNPHQCLLPTEVLCHMLATCFHLVPPL